MDQAQQEKITIRPVTVAAFWRSGDDVLGRVAAGELQLHLRGSDFGDVVVYAAPKDAAPNVGVVDASPYDAFRRIWSGAEKTAFRHKDKPITCRRRLPQEPFVVVESKTAGI